MQAAILKSSFFLPFYIFATQGHPKSQNSCFQSKGPRDCLHVNANSGNIPQKNINGSGLQDVLDFINFAGSRDCLNNWRGPVVYCRLRRHAQFAPKLPAKRKTPLRTYTNNLSVQVYDESPLANSSLH